MGPGADDVCVGSQTQFERAVNSGNNGWFLGKSLRQGQKGDQGNWRQVSQPELISEH
jgi:hypothetical protein